MLLLPSVPLPTPALASLQSYQREVDAAGEYPARVTKAQQAYKYRNRPGDPAFDVVKEKLASMCRGAKRCQYCEDSEADQVEHLWPKSLYPERTFDWLNLLYACEPCNRPKSNQFAVFAHADGALTEVSRKPKAPVVPPVTGDPVLINPRVEDPAHFMELDLRETFYFLPLAREGTREYERASYTIKVLGLNRRDCLPAARRAAYRDYFVHLSQYRHALYGGKPEAELTRLSAEIRSRQHPTVWNEMKRQHERIPALRELFAAVPDALRW